MATISAIAQVRPEVTRRGFASVPEGQTPLSFRLLSRAKESGIVLWTDRLRKSPRFITSVCNCSTSSRGLGSRCSSLRVLPPDCACTPA